MPFYPCTTPPSHHKNYSHGEKEHRKSKREKRMREYARDMNAGAVSS
jgi:hypothetical protein